MHLHIIFGSNQLFLHASTGFVKFSGLNVHCKANSAAASMSNVQANTWTECPENLPSWMIY